MSDTDNRPELQVYGPNERLPDRALEVGLPRADLVFPPGFPTTGFFRLLHLSRTARVSSRYAEALGALASAYGAAAGLRDAQLELSRAAARLRDRDNILATDQALRDQALLKAQGDRDEERVLAEVRKFRAELELYRVKSAVEEYKRREETGSTTPAQTLATEVEDILKRAFGDEGGS